MKISFCIPTFNRCILLRQTIESILRLDDKNIEIIVSDNASTDDTEVYIKSLQGRHEHIRYHKWLNTVDCGKNLLKVVELATCDYCWLLTDDDIIQIDSLDNIRMILNLYPELSGISVNVEGFDKNLVKKKCIRYAHKMNESKYFDSFEECYNELGAWFGYWSALIVNRKRWEAARVNPKHLDFHGYHHLFLVCEMIRKNPKWFFLNQKCVAYRADSESYASEFGIFNRYKLDLYSYKKIGEDFFGQKSKVAKKICKRVLNSYSFWQLVSIKYMKGNLRLLFRLCILSLKYYKFHPEFWYKLLPLFFMPRPFLLALRYLYRRLIL
ncbi:hypothetical protein COB11_03200 [Candidatus Aerophobetes bacterium]|uniref:Glycosyltransferase 2-like domain-containing protein n=1 Tax=Aerophobetes bacterium TaxID=2030807 RepID=A0A2A4Y9G8_UNCAE|nr:MAG: hypothetical protein COB11_08720 [Candidatus Aerophobetes bacterium]PCI94996.1 MAG: hypothetical protein COB11_03200 [Candidatus Aerophobetes bacterium]